jgi:hypothetical protein
VKLNCKRLVQKRKEQKGCCGNIAKGVLSDWPSQKWSGPSPEVTNPLEITKKGWRDQDLFIAALYGKRFGQEMWLHWLEIVRRNAEGGMLESIVISNST